MSTRMRMRAPIPTEEDLGTPRPAPSKKGSVQHLHSLVIGVIGAYALSSLALIPTGNPSPLARAVAGVLTLAGVSLAVAVIRWAPPWGRGTLMLVVGFTMMAVTGGVVAKRLTDGISPVDALGGLAGLASIVLVVGGWTDVLHRVRSRWTRIATAAFSSVLVAQFLLLPAGVALDVTNRPRPTGSERTPADEGLRFEDVRIRSADGEILAAWWVPPENGAALILLPGSGSTRHAVLDHAALVARHGYGALLLDPRGHGGSGGRAMEFGWGAEADVKAAVSYVLDRAEVTRGVGILGLSLGGEVGLAATALNHRIAVAVVEGVTARTWADARLEPDPHPVSYANEWMTFALVGLLAPEQQPRPLVDLARLLDAPVLMIAGAPTNEQKLDPIYARAASGEITLWSLSDAPHAQAIRSHPAAYEDRVIRFLDRAFGEATG